MEPTGLETTNDEAGELAAIPEAGPRGTMPPAEALERLARGETLRNVRIEQLEFRGDVAHPVLLENVCLVRPSFRGARFAEDVCLKGCTIDRPRFRQPSSFAKSLNLSGSTLAHATLGNLAVHGDFRADNIRTRGKFMVAGAEFHGLARFWGARFGGWAEFRDSRFGGEADLRSLHADEGMIVEGCRFEADALFRGSTVCKKFDANASRFERLVDLSKTKLNDYVYLEGIEQGPDQRFAFRNALAERLLVRADQLDGRLASEAAGDFAAATQEYALLKRAFESQHRYDQEDWAFYRFKVCQRRARPRSWRRPSTKLAQVCDWLFLDRGCGYGTNPVRAVCAAAIIILVFALIYMAGSPMLHVEHLPFQEAQADAMGNRILIGLLTSVSTFTSGFSGLDGAEGWMNLPLIAEALLGTLLWGLFIVAFSRKVIR